MPQIVKADPFEVEMGGRQNQSGGDDRQRSKKALVFQIIEIHAACFWHKGTRRQAIHGLEKERVVWSQRLIRTPPEKGES